MILNNKENKFILERENVIKELKFNLDDFKINLQNNYIEKENNQKKLKKIKKSKKKGSINTLYTKKILKKCFLFYSTIGNKYNNNKINSAQFYQMFSDIEIIDKIFLKREIDILFKKFSKGINLIDFDTFLDLLQEISLLLNYKQNNFKEFIEIYFFKLYKDIYNNTELGILDIILKTKINNSVIDLINFKIESFKNLYKFEFIDELNSNSTVENLKIKSLNTLLTMLKKLNLINNLNRSYVEIMFYDITEKNKDKEILENYKFLKNNIKFNEGNLFDFINFLYFLIKFSIYFYSFIENIPPFFNDIQLTNDEKFYLLMENIDINTNYLNNEVKYGIKRHLKFVVNNNFLENLHIKNECFPNFENYFTSNNELFIICKQNKSKIIEIKNKNIKIDDNLIFFKNLCIIKEIENILVDYKYHFNYIYQNYFNYYDKNFNIYLINKFQLLIFLKEIKFLEENSFIDEKLILQIYNYYLNLKINKNQFIFKKIINDNNSILLNKNGLTFELFILLLLTLSNLAYKKDRNESINLLLKNYINRLNLDEDCKKLENKDIKLKDLNYFFKFIKDKLKKEYNKLERINLISKNKIKNKEFYDELNNNLKIKCDSISQVINVEKTVKNDLNLENSIKEINTNITLKNHSPNSKKCLTTKKKINKKINKKTSINNDFELFIKENPNIYISILLKFRNDNEVINYLNIMHKSFKKIYYLNTSDINKKMCLKDFFLFFNNHKIVPNIITKDEFLKIFMTLNKIYTFKYINNNNDLIDYNLFLESFVIIAYLMKLKLKNQNILNKMSFLLEIINECSYNYNNNSKKFNFIRELKINFPKYFNYN